MGRKEQKEQSLSAERAREMMRSPTLCKEELRYIIQNVTGPGAEAVRKEAEVLLPSVPHYSGEQLVLQLVSR